MNAEAKLKEKVEEIGSAIKSGSLDIHPARGKLESAVLEYALDGYTDKEYAIPDEERGRLVTHYTSIQTLVSMLQSVPNEDGGFLRMYDSAHSNDPGEGNFLKRHLPKKYSSLIREEASHAYIASFVLSDDEEGKSRDNLAFWRAYGRNGEGCSLSFSLASHLPKNFRKVCYGDKHVDKFEKKLESFFNNRYAETNSFMVKIGEIHPNIQFSILKTIGEHMEKIRYLYKSKAYAYEKECRLVLLESDVESNDVCFECQDKNDSPARIRHYYEHPDLKIKKLLFSSESKIVIGPCVQNSDDVKYCIRTLLKRAKLDGPSVTESDIEYRKP